MPLSDQVAAVSCGIHRRRRRCSISTTPRISTAETDANFVLTGAGGIVEIQATAEGEPFVEAQFSTLLGARAQRRRASSSRCSARR